MLKTLVLIFIIIQYAWDEFLSRLNISFMTRNLSKISEILPDVLKSHINEGDYKKAVEYCKAKASFGTFVDSLNLVVIILVIWFSLLNPINEWTKDFPINRVIFCIVLLLISTIIGLPFKIYRVFVIEERFGFNKTTPKTFILDLIKELLISLIILMPLLWVLFYLYDMSGSYWWIWAFTLFAGFQFIMLIIYPLYIAPLFNKFTPLEEGELLDEIRKLTDKIKFPLKGVFIMDGSKRSAHSNAYFTGIGKSKRIVLYDTMVEKSTTKELVAVLGHELAHYKLHHVKIYLTISSLMSFIGFYILSLLLQSEEFFVGLGYENPSVHIGIFLLAFILPVVDMVFGPLFNMLSRKNEYKADSFSVNAVGEKESLPSALIKLNKDNLSNPLPHPLYSFINYSHPPLLERIKAIDSSNLV
ncbi:M48 family metallopeptidase [bacterium]|nr:M48 family metallopeptidase [bacterium]